MRSTLAVLILAAALPGCDRKVPVPKPPRLPDTPSPLVFVSVKPGESGPEAPFDLPKDKLYVISGTWKNHYDPKKGDYDRPGEFRVEKADDTDVDPKDLVPFINSWIDGSRVRVINQMDAPAGTGQIKRTIDYRTERTDGTLVYIIQPAVPAKKITITVDAREHRR